MSRWGYHIPILAYHRVGALKSDHVPTVSPETFERQLEFLVHHHYRVISLNELSGCLDRSERMPRRSVVITFDDGYEEIPRIAWPLLKHFDLPATLFVTPAEVGLAGFASWEQLTAVAEQGMTIGSHTMHHSYLPLVKEEDLSQELMESKRIIESRIGKAVEFLSYPVGGFTPRVQSMAKQAGYLAACTTNRALSKGAVDRYSLRRIKITERDEHILPFRVKISGYYDAFRQLRQPN
ncbi:MAG: polysaccharide deacetylase family protein [Candidatus Omnitrophica bacterium]|nr:polysaccharide deacetylase family protein [Candidatus Omnitrophota bacterium]MBI2174432.1 polysaccharide deacetylase family protein [Candidatus Omnitrophota bacterium]MBI3009956.1 polysaccharide deacetylase family protein [Candidatus Omnitrophota bacterium]